MFLRTLWSVGGCRRESRFGFRISLPERDRGAQGVGGLFELGFAYCCIRKNRAGWKVLKGNRFEPRWNGWVSPIVLGRRCRASVSRGGCSPLRLGSWMNPERLRCGPVPPARMSITELPVAAAASNRNEGFPPSTLYLPICVHLQNLWMKAQTPNPQAVASADFADRRRWNPRICLGDHPTMGGPTGDTSLGDPSTF